MSISRRILLTSAAASTVVAAPFIRSARAQTPEFTYKYANNAPASHPMNVRAQQASQKILAETDGRFMLKVFSNNQLGGDQDVLGQLRTGAVEFFTLSPLILSTMIPSASISGVGFAFTDYPAVWRALDGELGAYMRAQISNAGLIAMDKIWDNGFRQITTSTKPINTPADLANFKLRVLASPISSSMFKALGASPTTISFAETYSALQTRVTDGQENPLALISAAKLYEVQKYCSLTSHMWDGFWFLGNRRAWERLPAAIRDIVAKNVNDAGMAEREDTAALNASLQTDLSAGGMVFNKPDQTPFRDALSKAGFYAEWKGKFGEEAWSLLAKTSDGLN